MSRRPSVFAVAVLLLHVACRGEAPADTLTLAEILVADWGALEVQVESSMPEDRKGGTAIVLLHGYGGSGAAYEPLARAILREDTRVFLPTSVLPHASGEGAMWWEFLDEDWPKPYPLDPSVKTAPAFSKQLPRAREAVLSLIAWIRQRYRPDRLVLAGHSQGGMLALDVAAVVEPPADRVAVLASYVLLDSVPNLQKPRERRPQVFVSHGRGDTLVGFGAAEAMRELLEANDFAVTFRPHDGAHGVDATVTRDLLDFLAAPDSVQRPDASRRQTRGCARPSSSRAVSIALRSSASHT